MKIDLSKCFDRVDLAQSWIVLQRLGMPPGVLAVLKDFYSRAQRFMQVEGTYADSSIPCTCGLLQGCPASPMIFAAIVTVWAHTALRAPDAGAADHNSQSSSSSSSRSSSSSDTDTATETAPKRAKRHRSRRFRTDSPRKTATLSGAAYLDDRTIWATGIDGSRTLRRAYRATCALDKALGFVHNRKKGEVFATTAAARRAATRFITAVGPLVRKVKLLGVQHDTARQVNISTLDAATLRKIHTRLRRIGKATTSTSFRKILVRTMVLSMVTWHGPWCTLSKQQAQQLRAAVERTVLGEIIPGRSRFLVWTGILGPKLDPDFVADFAAVRNFQDLVAAHDPAGVPMVLPSRMRQVVGKWEWTHLEDGIFSLPGDLGVLDLGYDGPACIEHACAASWQRSLYNSEPRLRGQQLPPASWPCTTEHALWLATPPRRRVAAAAGRDGKAAARQLKRVVPCTCGEPNPSKQHLTWTCPDLAPTRLRQPTSESETRLLVPLFPLPPAPPPRRHDSPPGQLVRAILAASPSGNGRVLVASDGGAEGKDAFSRRAAWGAATGSTSTGAPVQGMDQSAPAAELAGLLQVLAAVASASRTQPRPVTLVLDNKGIADRARWAGRGLSLRPRQAAVAWKQICHIMSDIRHLTADDVDVIWVPSHGKKQHWVPPRGYDAKEIRRLNDAADTEATLQLKRVLTVAGPDFAARKAAQVWEQVALSRQQAQLQAFTLRWPDPAKPGHGMPRVSALRVHIAPVRLDTESAKARRSTKRSSFSIPAPAKRRPAPMASATSGTKRSSFSTEAPAKRGPLATASATAAAGIKRVGTSEAKSAKRRCADATAPANATPVSSRQEGSAQAAELDSGRQPPANNQADARATASAAPDAPPSPHRAAKAPTCAVSQALSAPKLAPATVPGRQEGPARAADLDSGRPPPANNQADARLTASAGADAPPSPRHAAKVFTCTVSPALSAPEPAPATASGRQKGPARAADLDSGRPPPANSQADAVENSLCAAPANTSAAPVAPAAAPPAPSAAEPKGTVWTPDEQRPSPDTAPAPANGPGPPQPASQPLTAAALDAHNVCLESDRPLRNRKRPPDKPPASSKRRRH